MKRLLAVLGALAMISGAVLVRGIITGDDGGGGGSSGGGGGGGDTHLVCVPELEAACAALAEEDDSITFEVEEAGATAARLTAPDFQPADSDVDGWLTLNPWPALVELRRDLNQDGPVLGEPTDVLATTPVDVVGPTERLDPLVGEVCDAAPETPVWGCFGDNAGAAWGGLAGGDPAWGTVNVGFPDPTQTATGLLVLGQASAEYFGALGGTTFARNDFDAGFSSWLGGIADSSPNLPTTAGTPLDQLLQYGESSWDAVGDLDWTTEAEVTGSRDEELLTVTYSSFMLAEAVAVPVRGHELPDLTDDDARNALIDAGFTNPTYDTDPELAVSPISPGLYQALLEEWGLAT